MKNRSFICCGQRRRRRLLAFVRSAACNGRYFITNSRFFFSRAETTQSRAACYNNNNAIVLALSSGRWSETLAASECVRERETRERRLSAEKRFLYGACRQLFSSGASARFSGEVYTLRLIICAPSERERELL